ncbi:MAG: hypothetical protein KGS72_13245 [Cyanobacteria bacterium REEB67]|nr:hypothetical protein [Cyanobacteria bacterium REEB67]
MIRPIMSKDRFRSERKPLTLRDAARAVQERLHAFMFPSSLEALPSDPVSEKSRQVEANVNVDVNVNAPENSVTAKITQNKLLSMLGTTEAGNESFRYRSKATITHNNLPVIIPPIEVVANRQGPAWRD